MKNLSIVKNTALLEILENVKEEITNSLGGVVKDIILYGSYAREEQNDSSDMDIIVLLDSDSSDMSTFKEKLADIKVDLSLKYDLVFSIIIKQYKQFTLRKEYVPFYSTIDREGIALNG